MVDVAVQATRDRTSLPQRIETVLPTRNARVRRAPMFDEEQTSAGSEHASHFCKCSANLGNAASGPRHHDRIHAVVGQRDTFGGTFKEVDGSLRARCLALSPCQ